ncbi:hypothetical protein NG796_17015 [Laspinema sp. A4]|uniref:hypothetical protein n=1 Tax=Laspinema sp. D2d TaxID=2953686 RepID=UPI0021BA45AF|nr:hypothetical protein [Laspinema sp. D2d]MCT7984975.1 hypothetical protein [Laspinema sp. D2d]
MNRSLLAGGLIVAVFLSFYLFLLRLILVWLAQFAGYPFFLNLALVSLVVVILAGGLFCWADDLDERKRVADIAVLFARPFVFYLGAVGCCLYAIAWVVGAVLLLPFSLFWPRKRAGLN